MTVSFLITDHRCINNPFCDKIPKGERGCPKFKPPKLQDKVTKKVLSLRHDSWVSPLPWLSPFWWLLSPEHNRWRFLVSGSSSRFSPTSTSPSGSLHRQVIITGRSWSSFFVTNTLYFIKNHYHHLCLIATWHGTGTLVNSTMMTMTADFIKTVENLDPLQHQA